MVVASLLQVMRAEAEAAEQEQEEGEEEDVEEDSAFGSNRSSSQGHAPPAAVPWGAETQEEEGVASWASVRMLGERQRRRAEKEPEQEEVLSLLLKGSVPHYTSHDASGAGWTNVLSWCGQIGGRGGVRGVITHSPPH